MIGLVLTQVRQYYARVSIRTDEWQNASASLLCHKRPQCLQTAALKHGIRNPESRKGITEMETEMEYGICERRFQTIDLKKNTSNDNKINKQIKKKHKWINLLSRGEETAVSPEESIPVKRRLIPLSAMNANSHGTAKRGEKRYWQKLVP